LSPRPRDERGALAMGKEAFDLRAFLRDTT